MCCVRLQDEAAALLAAATTPQHHHVTESGAEGAEGDAGSDAGSESAGGGGDLTNAPDDLVDPVQERRTLAERNERLHNQLKVTSTDPSPSPPPGSRHLSAHLFHGHVILCTIHPSYHWPQKRRHQKRITRFSKIS